MIEAVDYISRITGSVLYLSTLPHPDDGQIPVNLGDLSDAEALHLSMIAVDCLSLAAPASPPCGGTEEIRGALYDLIRELSSVMHRAAELEASIADVIKRAHGAQLPRAVQETNLPTAPRR